MGSLLETLTGHVFIGTTSRSIIVRAAFIFLLIFGIYHLFRNYININSNNYNNINSNKYININSNSYNNINSNNYYNNINSKNYSIRGTGNESKDNVKLVGQISSELQAKLDSTAALDTIDTAALGCQKYGINFTCKSKDIKSCPRETPPQSTRERIEQILLNEDLQVSPDIRNVSRELLAQVPGNYKLVILSALSSNHYAEGQAMLKSLHTKLIPRLDNFTVIVYDLGLTPGQHETYNKYCRCHLLKFPFSKLPAHFSTLGCFSWKPLTIRSHIDQAEFLLWVDSSIRFDYPEKIDELMKVTSDRGIQQSRVPGSMWIPVYTHEKMFDFFGESPCKYMPYAMPQAGFGMYHREPLVTHAILEPWLACVAQEACVCPMGQRKQPNWLMCPPVRRDDPKRLFLCHRNDQSALSIILAKVFGDKMYHFSRPLKWFGSVCRQDVSNYFEQLSHGPQPPSLVEDARSVKCY